VPDLQALLSPASIAVIGASPDLGTIRGRLLEHLLGHPYQGPVYPVSRSHAVVQGLRADATIAELPLAVDLAIIIVPAALVGEMLAQCGRRGIRAALIISSGFGEEVGSAGVARESELRAIAERHSLLVCGPNSEGFINARLQLAATFSPIVAPSEGPLRDPAARGRQLAVIGQSGAMTFALLGHARRQGLDVAAVVSTGNQLSLEAHDYVDYWLEGGVDIFLVYLEGIRDGARFRAVAERAARLGKPLIVARIGRFEAGRRAAASHTGALGGDARLEDAVFRHDGVIAAHDPELMVDLAHAFAIGRAPRGNRVALITGSGGAAAWMADLLAEHGLAVPMLEDSIQTDLRALLPSFAAAHNPVDATAQAIRQVGYARLVEIVRRSARIDAILLIGSLVNEEAALHQVGQLAPLAAATPIFFLSYTAASPRVLAGLRDAAIPCYTAMRRCARVLKAMADYARSCNRNARRRHCADRGRGAPLERPAPAAQLAVRGRVLTEWDAKALLAHYGIPRPREYLAASEDEAVTAARQLAAPVALKVQSGDIPHKTEAGAVALNVTGEQAVREAYRNVLRNATAAKPGATLHGVLIQPMARRGREMIVGIARHDAFGLMLMVGMGGVYAEILDDVAFAPVAITAAEARELLAELKSAALLSGVRGEPPADIEALADVMAALSRFAADHADRIAEIDLNPVIVHARGEGVTVADALIVTR
jgi:acyl-CoA synthetase (NDP forming)